MKDITPEELEGLQKRNLQHLKDGTRPSPEDEELAERHAAARAANEDEGPQFVVSASDPEAIKALSNFAPPVPSLIPGDDALYYHRYHAGKWEWVKADARD